MISEKTKCVVCIGFNKRSFTGLLFFVFIGSSGLAQQNGQKLPLQRILQSLEERHNITFTYIDKNIEGVTLTPPPDNLSLEKALQYLKKNTGLQFRQLNNRFVAINKPFPETVEICGFIRDKATGESIAGAAIMSNPGWTVSDDEGYFKIRNLSQNDSVIIQFIGYEITTRPVAELAEVPCKTVYLAQNVTTLQEVVVTNYITKGINKRMDGSFDINTATVGILPGLTDPDVLYTIQALPGIQSINETVSDINVRGGTNDQNLVLWDGIRMYQSGHFFGLISAFNPYLTQKVSLTKNGTTAFLGDGVSSTIDIQTDDYLTAGFLGGAGINLINGDVFAKIPLSKKASVHVSGRRSIADVLKTPTYEQYFERAFRDTEVTGFSNGSDTLIMADENFYFYDMSLKFLYDITTNDKLRLSFLNIFNNIEYQESELINDVVESRTSGLEQHNLAAGINYRRLWNDKLSTIAQLYLSWYELGAINFDIPNNQRLIQENEVLDTGLKLNAWLDLSNNINLSAGYQFFEVGISNLEDINNPTFRRLIKNVVRTHAVFAEGNYTTDSNSTNIRAGVRANYIQKVDEMIIEPRFAFNQRFLDFFSLEILGEMKNQTTTQIIDFQTDFLGIEKRRWVLSNGDDIPVIKSKQLSAGLHYKNNDLLLTIEGYLKQVDGITSSSQGFQNQFQFVRLGGSYNASGIDFLVNKKFDRITSWLSYSLAENTFEFSGFIPPTFPNNLEINHTITLGTSYQNRRLHRSAGLNWHTGRPFTAPNEENSIVDNEINYEVPNSSQLKDYLRVDLSARYNFRLGNDVRAQVGASVWNLLDRKNTVNAYYQINRNNQPDLVEQFSLGITPNFMFRVSF